MRDNLCLVKESNYCKITKINEKSFIIEIFSKYWEKDKFLCVYVIIFSYLMSKYLVVKKIYLRSDRGGDIMFRNMNFISNFSYIDFKLYIIKIRHLANVYNETKLFSFVEDERLSIMIEVDENSLINIEKKLGCIENLYPKSPLVSQGIMKELMGEIYKDFSEDE